MSRKHWETELLGAFKALGLPGALIEDAKEGSYARFLARLPAALRVCAKTYLLDPRFVDEHLRAWAWLTEFRRVSIEDNLPFFRELTGSLEQMVEQVGRSSLATGISVRDIARSLDRLREGEGYAYCQVPVHFENEKVDQLDADWFFGYPYCRPLPRDSMRPAVEEHLRGNRRSAIAMRGRSGDPAFVTQESYLEVLGAMRSDSVRILLSGPEEGCEIRVHSIFFRAYQHESWGFWGRDRTSCERTSALAGVQLNHDRIVSARLPEILRVYEQERKMLEGEPNE